MEVNRILTLQKPHIANMTGFHTTAVHESMTSEAKQQVCEKNTNILNSFFFF